MTGLGPTSGHACPFLKSVFSNENHELSLMRDQLPEEIWGLLADLPPKILNASFVDENLRNSQADPLMEVEMASGDPTFAYILVEHKSYQDAEAVLQMIGYMVRIWRNYIQEGTGEEGCATRARSLLPIIPLPGYSGAEPWKGPTCPADMMEIDAPKLTFLHGPNLILWQWAQIVNRHSTVTHYQRPTVTQLQEGGTGGEVSEILFFSAKSKRRPSLIYPMQIIPVCLSIVARRKGVSATRRGGSYWTPISLLVGHPCKLFHTPALDLAGTEPLRHFGGPGVSGGYLPISRNCFLSPFVPPMLY